MQRASDAARHGERRWERVELPLFRSDDCGSAPDSPLRRPPRPTAQCEGLTPSVMRSRRSRTSCGRLAGLSRSSNARRPRPRVVTKVGVTSRAARRPASLLGLTPLFSRSQACPRPSSSSPRCQASRTTRPSPSTRATSRPRRPSTASPTPPATRTSSSSSSGTGTLPTRKGPSSGAPRARLGAHHGAHHFR